MMLSAIKQTSPRIDLLPPDPYYGIVRGHVHVSLINGVDVTYQRTIEEAHVKRLAERWNQVLCDPILLAQREDGTLWIIKGNHRVRHHIDAGLDWVFATIIQSTGAREEADLFYVDATGVRLLKRFDKYRANTAREDAETVAMNECLARHGFRAAAWSGPRTIAAVGQLERVWSWGGEVLLGEVLDIIGGVWAPSEKAREGEAIAGLGYFLRSVRSDPNFDRMRLMQVLADNMPGTVMSLAIEDAMESGRGVQGNGRTTLFAIQLRVLYNRRFARKKLAPLTAPSGKRLAGQGK